MKMRDCPAECGTVDTYDSVYSVNVRGSFKLSTGGGTVLPPGPSCPRLPYILFCVYRPSSLKAELRSKRGGGMEPGAGKQADAKALQTGATS